MHDSESYVRILAESKENWRAATADTDLMPACCIGSRQGGLETFMLLFLNIVLFYLSCFCDGYYK